MLENKEDNIKNMLGKAYAVLDKETKKLEELMLKNKKHSEFIRSKTSSGCKLFFLRDIEDYRKELDRKVFFQSKVIEKTEEEIASIKNELLEIMKEKKIMEKLKERKLDEYNVILRKNEENAVDQLVTYKNSLLHR